MENGAASRRFTSNCPRVVLLALLLVGALAGCGSTLIYGDGQKFKTEVHDAHLLGELPVPGEAPILIFTGRPRLPCTQTDCDPKTSVFLESASASPKYWAEEHLRIPGNYYASDTGRLVARVRMFVGRCLDNREGVAWFIDAHDDRPQQTRFISESQVILASLQADLWSVQYGGGLWMSHFPVDTDISIARTAVSNHVCREISPQKSFHRTSDQYRSLDILGGVELMLLGSRPPARVKQWIKYFVTLGNTQGVVLNFAPEKYATSAYSNESLIVLTQSEYDRVSALTRSQICLKLPVADFHGGGNIVVHDQVDTPECALYPHAACDYLRDISELPDIGWTPAHLDVMRSVSRRSQCNGSTSLDHREASPTHR